MVKNPLSVSRQTLSIESCSALGDRGLTASHSESNELFLNYKIIDKLHSDAIRAFLLKIPESTTLEDFVHIVRLTSKLTHKKEFAIRARLWKIVINKTTGQQDADVINMNSAQLLRLTLFSQPDLIVTEAFKQSKVFAAVPVVTVINPNEILVLYTELDKKKIQHIVSGLKLVASVFGALLGGGVI